MYNNNDPSELDRLIAEKLREALPLYADTGAVSSVSLVLDMNHAEVGRAIYRYDTDEARRVGEVLTEGGA